MPYRNILSKLVLLSSVLISTSFPAHAILKEDLKDVVAGNQKSAPFFPHTHSDLVEYAKLFDGSQVYKLNILKPNGRFSCNAVRVSKNIVLTALHCVRDSGEIRANGKILDGYVSHPMGIFSTEYPDLAGLWLPEEGAHSAGLLKVIGKEDFASFSTGEEPVAFAVTIQDIQDDGMFYSHYKDTILSHEKNAPIGVIVKGNSGGGLFVYDEEKWKPIGIAVGSSNHKQEWAKIIPEDVEIMESLFECRGSRKTCHQDDMFKVLIERHEGWLTHMLDNVDILNYKFSILKSYQQYLEKSQNSVLLENFNEMITRRTASKN